MRRALRFLIPLTFTLAALIPGCYTILIHPSDDGEYRAAQTSDCVRCHGDYDEYPYGYYYSPAPSYWWEHTDYAHYYAYPWWWSYYDYPYLSDDYDYTGSSGRGTKFDRREVSREPAPPPHSDRTSGDSDYWNNDPVDARTYDIPASDLQGGSGSTGSSTSQRGSTTGSQSKDDNTGKDERTPRREITTDNNTNQDNAGRDRKQEDKPKETKTKTKKKSRRGGGG